MPVRGLKITVVVMGMMLVVGFVGLIVAIAYRTSHPRPSPAATAVPAGSPAQPFAAAPVDLPRGAQIEAVSAGSDRIVLSLVLPDGSRELLLLDMGSGRPIGTIPLRISR